MTAICGDIRIFDEAFAGFDWYLSRLPRGPGTWDLSPTGDLRLAVLRSSRLESGAEVPTIFFTFQLHLGPVPYLELLRAIRVDDDRLSSNGPPPS